jgi:hypothetical protein
MAQCLPAQMDTQTDTQADGAGHAARRASRTHNPIDGDSAMSTKPASAQQVAAPSHAEQGDERRIVGMLTRRLIPFLALIVRRALGAARASRVVTNQKIKSPPINR